MAASTGATAAENDGRGTSMPVVRQVQTPFRPVFGQVGFGSSIASTTTSMFGVCVALPLFITTDSL